MIHRCRICGNTDLIKILDLGDQTLTGVIPKNQNTQLTSGPIVLVKCNDEKSESDACGLVQLQHSYDLKELYGEHYGYRSGINQTMTGHLQSLARQALELVKLDHGDLILDIGSNDGTLLKSYPNANLKLIGIDPSAKKFEEF